MKKALLVCMAILLFVMCKKDNSSEKAMSNLSDQEIISKSKEWVEAAKLSHSNVNQLSSTQSAGLKSYVDDGTHSDPGNPNWSKAQVIRHENGIDITSVPYDPRTGSGLHLSVNGLRRMLVYSDESGKNRHCGWRSAMMTNQAIMTIPVIPLQEE